MVCRAAQFQIFVLPFVLGLSACQTIDNAPASATWSSAPLVRANEQQRRTDRTGDGAPLLSSTRGGQSTVIEGSGRFVGEPATGSIKGSSDEVADGVTLNLVNVPAPQAAKTILGDILSVRYTVDPGIEGKITIQTPRPVAKSAVIDLFQAALRANNAAIVNTNGMYRIVTADHAMVGASLRTEDGPDGEMVGSGLQVVQPRGAVVEIGIDAVEDRLKLLGAGHWMLAWAGASTHEDEALAHVRFEAQPRSRLRAWRSTYDRTFPFRSGRLVGTC